MSVRTYNPSVRVGNWNEDIQLEEDTLKDFLERKERGELLIQKSANLRESATTPLSLSVSRDGKVHFGDIVMIVNPTTKDNSRCATALSVNAGSAGGVTASSSVSPSARTAFRIVSKDGTPDGTSLKYGQSFYLCSAVSNAFLYSDRATFSSSAKKSRHNAVTIVGEGSHLTEWVIKAFNPQFRMELEYSDVPANERIIFTHMKTNQALCVEQDCLLRTPFGKEFELSSFSKLDSHKAEEDVNHWMIQMSVPGDSTMPMTAGSAN